MFHFIVQVLNITSGIEALEMFDSITYQKGALVIRMLQSYLGDESFQVRIAYNIYNASSIFSYHLIMTSLSWSSTNFLKFVSNMI